MEASQESLGPMDPGEQLPIAGHGAGRKKRRVFKASVTKEKGINYYYFLILRSPFCIINLFLIGVQFLRVLSNLIKSRLPIQ